MLKAISKRTRPSSRDAILDESHMKGMMRLYAINSHQAQSLTGKSTIVKQPTPRYVPLIKVNQAKPHESQGQYDIQHRVGELRMTMLKYNFTKIHTITDHTLTHRSTCSINHHTTPSVLFIRGVFVHFYLKAINLTKKAVKDIRKMKRKVRSSTWKAYECPHSIILPF